MALSPEDKARMDDAAYFRKKFGASASGQSNQHDFYKLQLEEGEDAVLDYNESPKAAMYGARKGRVQESRVSPQDYNRSNHYESRKRCARLTSTWESKCYAYDHKWQRFFVYRERPLSNVATFGVVPFRTNPLDALKL